MADQEVRYYRIRDDVHYKNRWYLGDVSVLDNWQLTDGSKSPSIQEILEVGICQDGREMDFTLTEVYGIPIVSQRFRAAIPILRTARYLPVRIAGHSLASKFFAVVIESLVECVDEDRSEFEKFTTDDTVRPDKAGEYSNFYTLALDKKKAQAADSPMFRLAKFEQAIIVDGEICRLLSSSNLTGIRMKEV